MISRGSEALGKFLAVCVCTGWPAAAPTAWKNFRNHWFYSILTKISWIKDLLMTHQQHKPLLAGLTTDPGGKRIDAARSRHHRTRWRASSLTLLFFRISCQQPPANLKGLCLNSCTTSWKPPWLWAHSTSTRQDGIRRRSWDDLNTSSTSRTL